MLKPGLGKGLDRLMNGDPVAGRAPAPPVQRPLNRGLKTLITTAETPPPPAAPKKQLLPTWFFFAADVLLLAYAVALVFNAPKPLDFGTILFCTGSVVIGAILALTGILRES